MDTLETKEASLICDLVNGRLFVDALKDGSNIKLYVKDSHYENNINDKSLVMIADDSDYVINNDFKFKSLKVEDFEDYSKFTFYSVNEKKTNKRTKLKYYVI